MYVRGYRLVCTFVLRHYPGTEQKQVILRNNYNKICSREGDWAGFVWCTICAEYIDLSMSWDVFIQKTSQRRI